jgi:preprotein translocase SecE subunit
MSILQYLKDTRGELRHVAWPTQTQTIVYTALVIALSILVAAYLGFFDYVFTTGLSGALEFLPQNMSTDFVPEATSTPILSPTTTTEL